MCSNGGMAERAKSAASDQTALLRQVPSVDELLLRPRVAALGSLIERDYLVDTVRRTLGVLRADIISGKPLDERRS